MARPPQRDAQARRGQALVDALPIETERLLIRSSVEDDAEVFLDIYSDPEVTRWLGGPISRTVEQVRERIELRRAIQERHGVSLWTVEELATRTIIGSAGLFPVEGDGPEIEVVYHFRKDRWGRGYATEAAKACLDYGFDVAGLDEIVGFVAPENVASARVLEKCGMTRAGTAHHYDMDLTKYTAARR